MSDEFLIRNEILNNEYKTRVAMIANSLNLLRSKDATDRTLMIRHYEELALIMQSTASRLVINSVSTDTPLRIGDHKRKMVLYENNEIYRLLPEWGIEFYSTDEEPDFHDERLFTSVTQVAGAISLVMRRSFDLYGAALAAVRLHSEHPQGGKVAAQWRDHYATLLRCMSHEGRDLRKL